MSKATEVEPSKITVPFMSSRKDLMMLRSLGGQPIFGRFLKIPSLLTRSKAEGNVERLSLLSALLLELSDGEDHV